MRLQLDRIYGYKAPNASPLQMDTTKDIAAVRRENNRDRTYQADGREFASLRELAASAGVSYQAAYKRLQRGWTDEEIYIGTRKTRRTSTIDPPKERKPQGRRVEVLGKTYENLRRAYDAISPSASLCTVRARIRYGWSPEEALEAVTRVDGRKQPLHPGAGILTINGENIISPNRDGDLPASNELQEVRRTVKPTSFVADGVEYKTYSALARAYGQPAHRVRDRIRSGWSAKEAVTEPVYEAVTVNGKNYRSAQNAWELIGQIPWTTYQARRAEKLRLEVCLGLEPLPQKERYTLDGNTYGSVAEVAAAFGLTADQLRNRLRDMSIEEAVKHSPRNGRYSEALFRKLPDLAMSSGSLYFVRVTLGVGILHKVGITQQDISQRFAAHNYEVIAIYQGTLLKLYQVEQQMLSSFQDEHCRADEDFDGKTETFRFTVEQEARALAYLASLTDERSCVRAQVPNAQ